MTGDLGRVLVILGVAIAVVGLVMIFADRIPFLGRLPGDIIIRRRNTTFYFPVVTMLVISIVLSLLFTLFSRK